MFVTFASDVNATYATIKPQPSRASLRKKRIKKDAKGYVDLLFTIDLDKGSYAKEVNLKLISDGYYSAACNMQISVLDAQKQNTYGTFTINHTRVWHRGETVTIGDVDIDTESLKPFANALNTILLMPSYEGLTSFYVRITFDREDFFTWDRGFFIRPEDYAPVLEMEVTDYITGEQPIYMCVEDTIPPPSIQGIYLFSSYGIIGTAGLYFYSKALDTRDIYIVSYTRTQASRNIYFKGVSEYVYIPPAPLTNYGYYTQRGLFWTFISGDLTSNRTLYFPITEAEETLFYINGNIGSDDFTVGEMHSPDSALQTLDTFFDGEGKTIIDDYDTLYIDGIFYNTLIFNQTLKATSPVTPITVRPSGEDETIIYGHIANEGSSCVANVQYEDLTFMPTTAINTSASGTTTDMISLILCDPEDIDSSDPYFILNFVRCKFLVPTTFENNIRSLVKITANNMGLTPLIITFDTCLFGVDGPGDLDYLVDLDRFRHTTMTFRNCSFLNPFGKANNNIQVVMPRIIDYTDATIKFENSIFWNILYSYDRLPPDTQFFRCFSGDPSLVSNLVGNPNFGKLKTTSPCYRKWLPRYGQNIGWDQTIPIGTKYHRTNIRAYGAGQHLMYTSISSRFDVRDKHITNISAAFVKLPYVMDTRIIATYAQMTLKLATEIPVVKTSILRLTTILDGSFPFSTDVLVTDFPLLKYPIFHNNLISIKEIYSTSMKNNIETDRDYECPIVMRYGIPEWYDPILGTKLYYYFDIYDSGSGVDISSLSIEFQGTVYKYGESQIKIQPLTVEKTAYRILFYPNIELPADTEYEISITVQDCSRNKGPIWDNRRANEVLNWGGLTTEQERRAMIPCLFTIYWQREPFYQEKFERWGAPRHVRNWRLLFRDAITGLVYPVTELLYSEGLEDDFDPHYTPQWGVRFSDHIEVSYTTTWGLILRDDNEASYTFNAVPLFQEIDPSVTIDYPVLVFAEDMEVFMPMAWQHIFLEEYQSPGDMLQRRFIDTFNWVPSITWAKIFDENYTDPTKVWDSPVLETFEWWEPYYDIIFIGELWTITTDWQQLFAEIEEPMVFDSTPVYSESGEWWEPYKEYTFEPLYSDRLEYIPPSWEKLLSDGMDFSAVWSLIFSENNEWESVPTYARLFVEDYEWYPAYHMDNKIYSDGFNVSEPPSMDYLQYSDSFDWNDMSFNSLFIDNNETDFLPYRDVAWDTDAMYTDVDPSDAINWTILAIFEDDLEQTPNYFDIDAKYTEGYERLGILSYALQGTYLFELVSWDAVPIYMEEFEYMDGLNYFEPFTETFEWSPTIAGYSMSLEEDMELPITWALLFVDDLES